MLSQCQTFYSSTEHAVHVTIDTVKGGAKCTDTYIEAHFVSLAPPKWDPDYLLVLKTFVRPTLMRAVKLNGGRVVTGVLRGFDPYMNIVMDDTVEEKSSTQKLNIGMVVSFSNTRYDQS